MTIRSIRLKDERYGEQWFEEVEDRWEYPDFKADPRSGEFARIATPVPHTYIQSIAIDRERELIYCLCFVPEMLAAYGVTGRAGRCEVLRFDFRRDGYELPGPVVDQDGEPCFQIHHVVRAADGTLYACENDNPRRSGYLWEITL